MTLVCTLLLLTFCIPSTNKDGANECVNNKSSVRSDFLNDPYPYVTAPSHCKRGNLEFFIADSVTGSQYVFIFIQAPPLLFFTENYEPYRKLGTDGQNLFGRNVTKLLLILAYLRVVFFKCTTGYFKLQLIRDNFASIKPKSRSFARKWRLNFVAMRKRLSLHLIVALLLLLLICGDVHPNPGPALQGNVRHPDRQLLSGGTWNVRTLVESKRTPIRPTAIVARELERYGIDIAALCETRILGESVIREVCGGYTFFLKGRPDGDKHYHGVGFAIRTSLVRNLEGKFPIGVTRGRG